jgi:hypothetical protein
MDCGGKRSATPLFPRWNGRSFSSAAHKFYKTNQWLFPLPAGEGQGEGERDKIPSLSSPLRAKKIPLPRTPLKM